MMKAFREIDCLEILPQRPPFVFVDRLLSYDGERTQTSFTVTEGHLLVEDGHLSAAGILENMAQSSAARIGYLNKFIMHIPVRVGYLGAIRHFKVYRLPAVGETLTTTVILREDVFGISLTDVTVHVDGEVVAEASLKTALSEKEAV